jgi:uncharacterized protein (TIGR02453 family)
MTHERIVVRRRQGIFSPEMFAYLNGLALNNHREWFEAHKQDYERLVREPALEFVRAVAPKLARVSPHFIASDRKVGGSLMRVFRDVRFSADKTPYKTNVGIQFRHVVGKDVHAPGFYVHLSTTENFVGVGVWHPDATALGKIRAYLHANQSKYRRVVGARKFRERYRLGGDSLVRAPRGFAEDHPLIEALKRKDHIAMVPLRVRQVTSPAFVDTVADHCSAAKGYMALLCAALEIGF